MDAFQRWEEAAVFFWPDELHGPWAVRVGMREVDGRMECVGFAVAHKESLGGGEPSPPSPVLTAKMVRTIPIGRYIDRTRSRKGASAAAVADLYDADDEPQVAAWVRSYAEKFKTRNSGRPRMYHDEHYKAVAEVYAEAYRTDAPPTQAVRDAFYVSHATAARWVRVCRQRGFLGEAKQRRAGGILPPRREETE